jgi:hypothetical protein
MNWSEVQLTSSIALAGSTVGLATVGASTELPELSGTDRHETRTEWRAARELPNPAETPAQIEAPLPALRTQVQDIRNSGHAPGDASKSAIIANLPPGNYTAIVRGVSNTLELRSWKCTICIRS